LQDEALIAELSKTRCAFSFVIQLGESVPALANTTGARDAFDRPGIEKASITNM
jgi:hypothetical protein